jgi:hypothetical protein
MGEDRDGVRTSAIRVHRVGTATDAVFRATEALSRADDNDTVVIIRNTNGDLVSMTNLGSCVDRIALLATQLIFEAAAIVKQVIGERED